MGTEKENEVMGEIHKLLEDSAIKDTLAAGGLRKLLTHIESLEISLSATNKTLEATITQLKGKRDDMHDLEKVHVKALNRLTDIEARELNVAGAEKDHIRSDIRLEFAEKQIVFLERQSDMILRNAEIKKTINSIVPLAIPAYTDPYGSTSGGGVELTATTSNTSENQV